MSHNCRNLLRLRYVCDVLKSIFILLWNAVSRVARCARNIAACFRMNKPATSSERLVSFITHLSSLVRGQPTRDKRCLTRRSARWEVKIPSNDTSSSIQVTVLCSYQLRSNSWRTKFQLFSGHLERSCEGCSPPTYNPDTIIFVDSDERHHRTLLAPSVFPHAVATDRSLTTRLQHRAVCLVAVSTACRRSVATPPSSRRRAESVEVVDQDNSVYIATLPACYADWLRCLLF